VADCSLCGDQKRVPVPNRRQKAGTLTTAHLPTLAGTHLGGDCSLPVAVAGDLPGQEVFHLALQYNMPGSTAQQYNTAMGGSSHPQMVWCPGTLQGEKELLLYPLSTALEECHSTVNRSASSPPRC
jgi:hypothetical protein